MDIYTDTKSRWRPNSKSRHGGSRKCSRSCTVCHPTRLAANKAFIAKDLDEEYRKPSAQMGVRPAKEYVDWFFAEEELAEESVWGDGDWSAEEVGMVMGIGKSEFERMVKEHVEAEKQLERDKEKRESAGERRMEITTGEEESADRDWDVVSTGSVDSIRLEDWEEIIVE